MHNMHADVQEQIRGMAEKAIQDVMVLKSIDWKQVLRRHAASDCKLHTFLAESLQDVPRFLWCATLMRK